MIEETAGAETIWLTIRDPRDCITSWMLYQHWPFEAAVDLLAGCALFRERFAADPRTRLLRYEDGFIDDIATLDRIADGFGAPPPEADRARIFEETRRASIEKHIGQFASLPTAVRLAEPGHIVGSVTQWHTHRANRDGEVGRWRHALSAEQVAAVEQRLGR